MAVQARSSAATTTLAAACGLVGSAFMAVTLPALVAVAAWGSCSAGPGRALGWDGLAGGGRADPAGGVAAVLLPLAGDPHRVRLPNLLGQAGGLPIEQAPGDYRQAAHPIIERVTDPGRDRVQLAQPAQQPLPLAGGVVQVGGAPAAAFGDRGRVIAEQEYLEPGVQRRPPRQVRGVCRQAGNGVEQQVAVQLV